MNSPGLFPGQLANPLVSEPTAFFVQNVLLYMIFRVFNKVILFYVVEENVLGEELLMEKLSEISHGQ